MKLAPAVLVAVAAIFGSACSSASSNEGDASEASASISERIVVDASAETRSALGVTRWGISVGSDRFTIVRGYDAGTEPVVEYRQLASSGFRSEEDASAYPYTFQAGLKVRGHLSTLSVEATDTDYRILNNDFDSETRLALARIEADLKDQPFALPKAESLTTQDLANDPNCLAQQCGDATRAAGANGAFAAGACVDGTGNCAPGVVNANTAQGASDASCQCGAGACLSGSVVSGPAVRPHVQTFASDLCCAITSDDGSGGGCKATTYDGHKPVAALAIDIPVSPGGYGHPPASTEFGDRIVAFALENKAKYKIEYVIWQQRIRYGGDGDGSLMEDRGSPTQNHYDHVHVSFQP